MNPYLREFGVASVAHDGYRRRNELVTKYSWSVPTDEAVEVVAALPDIVDIGAGTGYWASLIASAGGTVRCFDIAIGDRNHWKHHVQYYPIGERGIEVLRSDARECYTMLLAWPPYNTPMGFQAVRSFRGRYIVYIGEGDGGCTGDDAMHRRLDRDWLEVRTVVLPQWEGIHDALVVYERK